MSGSHYASEPPQQPILLSDWIESLERRVDALEKTALTVRGELRVGDLLRLDTSASKPLTSDERTHYDLRTATQHEQDDAAQLALRIDNLLDVTAAQAATIASRGRAIAELRGQVAELTQAAITDLGSVSHEQGRQGALLEALMQNVAHHADVLTVLQLREDGI